MLYITKKEGKTTSTAICDKCGEGFSWDGNISLTRMEYLLRKRAWRVGKQHICDKCKEGK